MKEQYKHMKFSAFLLPVAMAGMLAAQTATAPQAQNPASEHPRNTQHLMLKRMTARLNLTPDQQTQAKAIFARAREKQRALRPKLREERMALRTAVKADNETQIDRILHENSKLNTQVREIHTKAVAQFYKILNPGQEAQFDRMAARRWNGRGNRRMTGAATRSTESR